MKRILVTGGAGFIGSAVVRHIINETAPYTPSSPYSASKIARELRRTPEETIEKTMQWHLANEAWWKPVQNGSYQGQRLGLKG